MDAWSFQRNVKLKTLTVGARGLPYVAVILDLRDLLNMSTRIRVSELSQHVGIECAIGYLFDGKKRRGLLHVEDLY